MKKLFNFCIRKKHPKTHIIYIYPEHALHVFDDHIEIEEIR